MARRDRGLNAAEQDAYLQWLREDPANGVTIARLEKTWDRLEQLSLWRPAHSPRPNPDLLAPRHRKWGRPLGWLGLLGAAAAIVLAAITWWPRAASTPSPLALVHRGPEHMTLADGSVVDLHAGAKIQVNFTEQERRVHLTEGEAHFTVAKNPARPFIVSADKFAVRAVGTAFSVSLDADAVSVLVTEGKVRLDETAATGNGGTTEREMSHLIAGQQAVVSTHYLSGAMPAFEVRDVSAAEMERAWASPGVRLEFIDRPLRDVVNDFNRYNARKLVIGDIDTGKILVGGNFRADNVDAFVRLLDSSFEVSAFPSGNEVILRRRH
jgi:transmembrane sensor